MFDATTYGGRCPFDPTLSCELGSSGNCVHSMQCRAAMMSFADSKEAWQTYYDAQAADEVTAMVNRMSFEARLDLVARLSAAKLLSDR
ncbi:MAG: hypothetical protein J5J06_09350 [Phycisphaerae bacterium]|nr:hypothetical protein [Phycisphaerae bacterium]